DVHPTARAELQRPAGGVDGDIGPHGQGDHLGALLGGLGELQSGLDGVLVHFVECAVLGGTHGTGGRIESSLGGNVRNMLDADYDSHASSLPLPEDLR